MKETITRPLARRKEQTMKRTSLTLLVILLTGLLALTAQAQDLGPGQANGRCQFIDEDGDGFNDLAPDADGDGIPNGLDEDYVKPEDGDGNMYRHMWRYMWRFHNGNMGDDAQHRFGRTEDGPGGHFGPGQSTGQGGQNGEGGKPTDTGHTGSGGGKG